MRNVYNSSGTQVATLRERSSRNPAFLHPQDMDRIGATPGDTVLLTSDRATISARAEPDDSMLPGTVALAHGWGDLPGHDDPDLGSPTNRLVNSDEYDRYSGIHVMSALPVRIRLAGPVARRRLLHRDAGSVDHSGTALAG